MRVRKGSRNRVRIIGGECRGRVIDFVDHPGLRPTGDRVRETLFNWLQADIQGARCLDLFSGSGVLGFEAVSRGARQALMLEKSARVAERLGENARLLGIQERVKVVCTDAIEWLEKAPVEAFDLVFVDPPFARQVVDGVLHSLADRGWVTSGSKIYVEQDLHQTEVSIPSGWSTLRDKTAGQVRYRLLCWSAGEGALK